MKTKLEGLHQETMAIIKGLASKGDAANISRVATTASKIKLLQEQLLRIEDDVPRIEETIAGHKLLLHAQQPPFTPPEVPPEQDGKNSRKKIRIEIVWARLGKPGDREIICEHKSSDTMTKFVARLYQEFGDEVLEKLSAFRINRGPMLSKNPKVDFRNKTQGKTYGHQKLADSGYYILTHSGVSEKLQDLEKACRSCLRLPSGSVLVQLVEKDDMSKFDCF